MPYDINWYVEYRVLRLQIFGDGAEQDFLQSSQDVVEVLRQQTSPVMLMVDFREAGKINFSLSPLKTLAQFRTSELPLERIVIVSDNAIHSFFSTIAGKVTSLPVAVFKTIEEANDFIARHAPDVSLPQERKETSS